MWHENLGHVSHWGQVCLEVECRGWSFWVGAPGGSALGPAFLREEVCRVLRCEGRLWGGGEFQEPLSPSAQGKKPLATDPCFPSPDPDAQGTMGVRMGF